MNRFPLPFAIGMLLILFFTGCRSVSPPIRYYTLSAIPAPDGSLAAADAVTIGLMPVRLPGYINRTQMVLREGNDRLAVSSLDRWADFPDRLIPQVLSENLQGLLPQTRVVASPWPVGIKPDLRLTIQILEMIGTDDHQVVLNADWSIASTAADQATFHRLQLSEPLPGSGFDGLAAAHSRVLAKFSRSVAETLKTAMAASD